MSDGITVFRKWKYRFLNVCPFLSSEEIWLSIIDDWSESSFSSSILVASPIYPRNTEFCSPHIWTTIPLIISIKDACVLRYVSAVVYSSFWSILGPALFNFSTFHNYPTPSSLSTNHIRFCLVRLYLLFFLQLVTSVDSLPWAVTNLAFFFLSMAYQRQLDTKKLAASTDFFQSSVECPKNRQWLLFSKSQITILSEKNIMFFSPAFIKCLIKVNIYCLSKTSLYIINRSLVFCIYNSKKLRSSVTIKRIHS